MIHHTCAQFSSVTTVYTSEIANASSLGAALVIWKCFNNENEPEIDLGLNYSWGSIPRLVHLVGPAKAKQMIILAERIPAEQCALWGLADQVVSDGSALEASISLADKVLGKPPIPVAMTKQAVNMVFQSQDRSGIHMDADQFMLTTYTQDHREGLAAFLEKRKPEFKGK